MNQDNVYGNLTHDVKSTIYVGLPNMRNELKILKEQKDKLTNLLERIRKSRDEYVSSNLSGKTYESSVRNNDLFVKNIENRINECTILINKLEDACNLYNETILTIGTSVKAGEK